MKAADGSPVWGDVETALAGSALFGHDGDGGGRLPGGTMTDEKVKPAKTPKAISTDPALLRRLLRAKDRMDAASDEEWPVTRLASVSGVSEAHFARSFKDAFGVPPHRYLLTRRLERVTSLLRDTDLSITEIAFLTGWSSLGTFGRTFRDITGKTPSMLRAEEREAPRQPALVPACILAGAERLNLTIAVSEKRRRETADNEAGSLKQTEVP